MSSLVAACAGLIGRDLRHADGEIEGHGERVLAMPWLDPYRAIGVPVARDVLAGQPVAEALNAALHRALITTATPPWCEPPTAASAQRIVQRDGAVAARDLPRAGSRSLHFVSQTELPVGEPYEAFIARTGCVPTRDNAHDLFNGLVWLRFPQIKHRLNALHAAEIARDGVGRMRGAVRDTLTLFDENAALWAPSPDLADALTRRDWHRLFVTYRPLWQAAPLILFGHALLEKLVQPRKAITAHAWAVSAGVRFGQSAAAKIGVERSSSGNLAAPRLEIPAELASEVIEAFTIDVRFAESLSAERLSSKAYLPIPVLGVPGWWPDNEQPGFYDDSAVFRPLRAFG